MSVVVSHSTFAAAIAAAAHINTLRSHRYVLWKYDADAESWVRITHHPSAGFLRMATLPEFAYLISEEFVDIHGARYNSAGAVLGDQPVAGMLREAHPHVKWINPEAGDPFPWVSVSDVDGAECVAPFGIPAGWVSRIITVESGLVVPPPEEEEEDNDDEDDGLMEE